MKIVRKFEWRESGNKDNTGWVPKLMPTFDVVAEGMLMAHDLLEHFNAHDDSVEAECMALGSAVYLRAMPEYWGNCNSGRGVTDPAKILCGDLDSVVIDSIQGSGIKPVKRAVEITDEDVADMFAGIAENVIWPEIYERDDAAAYQHNQANALDWMRLGYVAAERRWGLSYNDRLELFFAVENACDAYLQNEDEFERCAGDILTVTVDTTERETTFRVKSMWDRHYD